MSTVICAQHTYAMRNTANLKTKTTTKKGPFRLQQLSFMLITKYVRCSFDFRLAADCDFVQSLPLSPLYPPRVLSTCY